MDVEIARGVGMGRLTDNFSIAYTNSSSSPINKRYSALGDTEYFELFLFEKVAVRYVDPRLTVVTIDMKT